MRCAIALAMHRFQSDGFQDQKIQCSLNKVRGLTHQALLSIVEGNYIASLVNNQQEMDV